MLFIGNKMFKLSHSSIFANIKENNILPLYSTNEKIMDFNFKTFFNNSTKAVSPILR